MKKSQVFSPDVRNLGGRKILVDQIYNHRISLDNIKPIIGSFDTPQSMAKKGKNIVSFKEIEDQQNLILMQNKISKVKKSIDNNKPISFDLIRQGQPGGATSKQYQFMLEEHYKNLLAQKRQIESFGSMNDRKKNINDFIAYPPKFFRRLNNNQINQYNQFKFPQKSLQNGLQSRPKTANPKFYNSSSGNIFNQKNSTSINAQNSQSQILHQNYNNQLTNEQQQMLYQHHMNHFQVNSSDPNNQQEIYFQQIQQGDGQNGQIYEQQQNNYQETTAKQYQNQNNGLNIQNNSISSAGYTLVSPTATTATVGFSSQVKGSPFQIENQQNSFSQNHNIMQNSPQKNVLINQIINHSLNKSNSQSQKKFKSAGNKSKQNLSNISNVNKSAAHSQSDKSKKSGSQSTNNHQQQKSQTMDLETSKKYMDEEQKWTTIIEEVPQLEDISEESLRVLKMHLINIIIEFRLYRLTEYESMKQIFIEKNREISLELVEEIFSEIIEALNE